MKATCFLVGAAIAVTMCSTAFARIGETLEQCIKRYGSPDSGPEAHEGISSAVVYWFVKSGRDVCITFDEGVAVDLLTLRLDRRGFSSSDVQKMLEDNKASPWTDREAPTDQKRWVSTDGERHAHLTPNRQGTPDASFAVWTDTWQLKLDGYERALRDPLRRALDGAETAIKGVKDLLGY